MSFFSYSTDYKGVVDVLMHDVGRYLPFSQLMAKIMSGESELSAPQREMIALHVSALNDCHYCVGSHRAVLASLGVDHSTIAAVEAGAVADEQMQPVLVFAAKLTQHPGEITRNDVDTLCKAGWSERAVEDIINVVSLFSFLNRLVDGFGIKGSTKGFSQAGEMIAEHGYEPVVQMLEQKEVA